MNNTIFYFGEESFLDIIEEKKYSKIILLADAKTNGFCVTVLKKYFPAIENSHLIVIPDGENSKSIESCQLIWTDLLRLNADKHTLVINVGGGMISDIGGFAAATYKRGIQFMNIPTTLLAMADASYGGKNGVNLQGVKNVLGTIQHPVAVYINPVFLQTLAERNLRSGIAEILKHALLHSEEYFNEVVRYEAKDFFSMDVIRKTVMFKSDIVSQDEYDEQIRQTLNLGHTLGHALESFSLNTENALLHGEAIILGLIYELMISHMICGLPLSVVEDVCNFKNAVFPEINVKFAFGDIEKYLLNDKKNDSDIKMSLLSNAGYCKWQIAVTADQITSAIAQVHSLPAFAIQKN